MEEQTIEDKSTSPLPPPPPLVSQPLGDGSTSSSQTSDLRNLLKRKRASSTSSSSTMVDDSPPKNRRGQRHTFSNNTNSEDPQLQRARLFVGNINPNVVFKSDLVELFSKYGNVLGVSLHNGFAFVQMDEERAANRAINHTSHSFLKGLKIEVEFSEAALEAGAKFTKFRASRKREGMSLPPRPHWSPPPPPAPPYIFTEERLKEREARLARILEMEREIARLRSGDVATVAGSQRQRPHPPGSYSIYQEHVHYPSPQRVVAEEKQRLDPRWEMPYLPAKKDPERPRPQSQKGPDAEKPHPPLPTPADMKNRWHHQPPLQVCYNGEAKERPLVQVFIP